MELFLLVAVEEVFFPLVVVGEVFFPLVVEEQFFLLELFLQEVELFFLEPLLERRQA